MKPKHQKQHSKFKLGVIVGSLCLLVLVGLGTYYYFVTRSSEVTTESKSPLFAFDAKRAPGWQQSATDTTSVESRQSILLFDHDISAPPTSDNIQSCHASAFLNAGTVDIKAKRKEIESNRFGHVTTPLDTKTLSLQTSSGAKQYKLYQYQTKAPKGAAPMKEGYAYGYIQVDSHYIELQVVCDSPRQLKSAIPALQAISFDDTAPRE